MLRVDQLSYEIKGRKLLKEISFQVRKGEVLAILGANGAGKSTLMRLIAGEEKPSSGSISLFDKKLETYDKRSLACTRAMLSQQQHITMAFSVRELIIMGRYPHYRTTPSLHDWQIVDEVMELCGIAIYADRVYLSLSGGEQQRVQLARVLAQLWDNPNSLLLLDEPISALDLHYQQRVLAIAKALSRKGLMVVMVVHDLNFASTYADRIIMLKNGRKWLDGPANEVLNTKDIYRIFNVEAAVEINLKSLKPVVLFDEMQIDDTSFNSKIKKAEADTAELHIRYRRLQNQFPQWSAIDYARELGVDELAILLLNSENKITWLAPEAKQWMSALEDLPSIQFSSKNHLCQLQTIGSHKPCSTLQQDSDLIADDYGAVAIENTRGKRIAYYGHQGNIFHEIIFADDEKSNDCFLKLTKKWCTSSRKLSPQTQRLPTVDTSNQQLLSDVADFKQSMAHSVNHALPITITLFNESYTHSYSGAIHNLIDQGHTYMIRDKCCFLRIKTGHSQWFKINENSLLMRCEDTGLPVLKCDFGSQHTVINKQQ